MSRITPSSNAPHHASASGAGKLIKKALNGKLGQRELTNGRDIIVKGNRGFAIRAVGRWRNQRLVLRQADDADIEKAADDGAKNKD